MNPQHETPLLRRLKRKSPLSGHEDTCDPSESPAVSGPPKTPPSVSFGAHSSGDSASSKDLPILSDEEALLAISNLEFSKESHRNLSSFELLARTGRRNLEDGEPAKAMQSYEKALRLKHSSLKTEPVRVKVVFANVLHDIGWIHASEEYQEYLKSIYSYECCRDILGDCYGPQSYSVALVLCRLGEIYGRIEDHQSAVNTLSEALSIILVKKPKSPQLMDTWAALGHYLQLVGRKEDADACFTSAENLGKLLDRKHPS